LRRARRGLIAWTHTRIALWLGTGLLVLMGAAAFVSLIMIGVFGRGAYHPPQLVSFPVDSGQIGPLPPDASALFPPFLTSTPALTREVSDSLAHLALQQSDLPDGMTLEENGATGEANLDGLLGSYHAVYQRSGDVTGTTAADRAITVFSLVGAYTDALAASHQLTDVAAAELGAEAGLPQLVSQPVAVSLIGDETHAFHLTGQDGSAPVGVYVVEFRSGPVNGIVGVAWPHGQESLDEAVALARLQAAHLSSSGGAQTVPTPPDGLYFP
jgi:hypothetical protein